MEPSETEQKSEHARQHILARSADGEVVRVKFSETQPPRQRLLQALFSPATAPKRGLLALLHKEARWHNRKDRHGQDVCHKRIALDPLGIDFDTFLTLWDNLSQEFRFSGTAKMQSYQPTIVEVELPRWALEQAQDTVSKWLPTPQNQR